VRWPSILRPVGLSVIGHADIAAARHLWRNGARNIAVTFFSARGFSKILNYFLKIFFSRDGYWLKASAEPFFLNLETT
jgi:hypothetical protein